MNRLVSFDYIRVISILGIVLCHCCYGITGMSFLGRFLGLTFNVVFLILSAFLLGLSWEKNQCKEYTKSFIFHRVSKLAYSYYPFIIIMFVFLYMTDYHVTINDWIMHLLFLPWFDKLPGFGHLWFVTMIVICYMGIYIISKPKCKMLRKFKSSGIIFALLSQIILGVIGVPNYLFLYLILYLLAFLNARSILEWINRIHIKTMMIVCCIVVPMVISLFYLELTNKYTSVWGGLICAIIILGLLNKLFSTVKENRFVSFISTISFEIYLVHHVFCFGNYSVFQIIGNPILGIIVIFLISVLLAYFLHSINGKINAYVMYKLR